MLLAGKIARLSAHIGFFLVSLSWMAANVKAQGSVEISSPEESIESSLSGSSLQTLPQELIPSLIPALGLEQVEDALNGVSLVDPLAQGQPINPTIPLFGAGVFPYQVDPLSAIVAAVVVLGVQSYLETGKVDPRALAAFLNRTDFYAGVAGAAFFGVNKYGAGLGLEKLALWAAPQTIDRLASVKAMRALNHLVSGVTYTIAVSGGYHYWSQFWMMATAGVSDDVKTVTGFINARLEDQVAVGSNLLRYLMMADIQKRVVASVYRHKIQTFEFMAMNAALYFGIVAGGVIAERIGGPIPKGVKRTWARRATEYFLKVTGGIFFGTAIQFIPESFRLAVNSAWLDSKIRGQEEKLDRFVKTIEDRILLREYSAGLGRHRESLSLTKDLDTLFRIRDLIVSLYAQRLSLLEENDLAADSVIESLDQVTESLDRYLFMCGGSNVLSNSQQSDQLIRNEPSLDRLGRELEKDLFQDEFQKSYAMDIDAYLQRHKEVVDAYRQLFQL